MRITYYGTGFLYHMVRKMCIRDSADAKYWGRTSPVLFPFVGGVKNKVYRHEGKEYPMNQHGFARDMDFTLISRSTDEAWLALEDTDETRKVYPFHFHLEIGYRPVSYTHLSHPFNAMGVRRVVRSMIRFSSWSFSVKVEPSCTSKRTLGYFFAK